MKTQEIYQKVNMILDLLENYEAYSKLFDEIARDIKREIDRNSKQISVIILGKARKN
jgi:hypothetical protein